MKKFLKRAIVLVMAGVMTIAPVMTASAETAVVGETYQMTYLGWYEEPATPHQVVYSNTPIYSSFVDGQIATLLAQETQSGYEIKSVYIYLSEGDLVPEWWIDIEGHRDLVTIPEFNGITPYSPTKIADFTVDFNGQTYTNCAIYVCESGCKMLDITDYINDTCFFAALKLPQGFNSNSYIQLFDSDDNGNRTGRSLDYYFSRSGESADPAATAFAPSWKQDAQGWRIENPDGTYLTNQWYQSPESGLWYYMGADGYMLTNTTTPDGYAVNADGVWVQ